MYGSLSFLPPINFTVFMASISFNFACKEMKIAQIAQVNQLFQLRAQIAYTATASIS